MKPKTKKTLIWVAAVAIVVLIVWLVFLRKNKNSVKSILRHLAPDLNGQEKAELEAAVAVCETWPDAELTSQLANTELLTRAQLVVINALWDTCLADDKIRTLQSKVIAM